ncbi:sensor histidine kinase [Salinimicrobium sp. TIG7-5_MAKvit]|uniref:sensor histidine kinase n=1 Tax=Salinimicrobium sp. TIG7-5_MAKvit TaxID=3121289 RepID=UPI003C6E9739
MKKLLFILFLYGIPLWSQHQGSVLTSKSSFSSIDGYLISKPYQAIYDTTGWLWILGENNLSNEYILGEREVIIQRFDGANFFTLKLPDTFDKKIEDGHFFKHKANGLYLKLFYKTARAEFFYINTETLEIKAVKDYNELNKNYLFSEAYTTGGLTLLALTSKDKFYSAALDKLKLTLIDSVPFSKPISEPILADPVTTNDFTIIKLLSEKEGYFLNKEGKFLKKISEGDFVTANGTHFFPQAIHSCFKVGDAFYVYADDTGNAFKFDKTLNKFTETPNTGNLLSSNKTLKFTPDFKHALSTGVFRDHSVIALYKFTDFKNELLTKMEVKNSFETAYKEFGKDLVVLHGNTLETYFFIKSQIKTFLKGESVATINKLTENNYIVATETGRIYRVDVKNNTEERIEIQDATTGLAINSSRGIFIEKDNSILIGDAGNFYSLDPNFRLIQNKTLKIPGEQTIKIRDTLYSADHEGAIFKYSMHDKSLTKLTNKGAVQVKEFTTDGSKLYAISNKGIFEYGNGIFNTYEFETVETDHLLSIKYLESHGLLVSTKYGEIYRFDTSTKKLKSFYEGSLNTSIMGMVADASGTLWLNTYSGIVSLDPSLKKVSRFTAKDGLHEVKGNMLSTYRDEQDGSILMGSQKGLSYFKPGELVENKVKVQPQFTSISLFNSDTNHWEVNTSPDFLNNTRKIVLPSEYRRFSATLSVFGQMNPRDIKFRYRLLGNGNTSNWFTNYSGKEILYANLSAETYDLQVEALNSSNQKIGERISLEVISKEVFYKTWWFILLLLFLISISVFYLFYQYKEKQVLFAKNRIAVNEAKIKNVMMLEIHHRIKNNLQIVSGLLGLQIVNSRNDELKEKLQDSQSRIESIAGIHNLLYNSSKQNLIPVKENIENSIDYYKKLFPINATYHLNIDASILDIDQATPFSLLLNELINNSYKHAFTKTENPEIYIHFEKQGNKYVFKYSDNGSFNNEKSPKQAMGMKIIEMMNKQLKGNLSIENSTSFKLTLFFPTNE